MKHTLIVNELHFDGAHYLTPAFGQCQFLHGHRWYVRNLLLVEVDTIIDFSLVKKVIDGYDHCLIVPETHREMWEGIRGRLPCNLRLKSIPYPLTLVEHIKDTIKDELFAIEGVESVVFELYETDNAGVSSECL